MQCLQGQCEVERPAAEGKQGTETVSVAQGSLVGCTACLSSTRARATVRAAKGCKIAAFGAAEMESVLVRPTAVRVSAADALSGWLQWTGDRSCACAGLLPCLTLVAPATSAATCTCALVSMSSTDAAVLAAEAPF